MRLVVINHITLDGVMQSPGRPDEDTRGGFTHGGWATAGSDEVMSQVIGRRMGRPDGGLLLGRLSYEEMLSYWNSQGGPYKDSLMSAAKYVVSSKPSTTLEWPNSTLVHGDISAAVADIKGSGTGDLVIMGSGQLIRSLLPMGLIDEYFLMIHPIVLGSGRRLFGEADSPADLKLVGCTQTSTGVLLATYIAANSEPTSSTDSYVDGEGQ